MVGLSKNSDYDGMESKWLVLLELVKDRLLGCRSLEHHFSTNHILDNGKASQLT